MAASAFLQAVDGMDFFAGLDEHALEILAATASSWTVKQGDYLMTAGEAADRFYAVRKGHVLIEIRRDNLDTVEMDVLGPRDIVGWSWLQPPYAYQFHAMALEEGEVIIFDAVRLRRMCQTDIAFHCEMLRRVNALLLQRLLAARRRILGLYA